MFGLSKRARVITVLLLLAFVGLTVNSARRGSASADTPKTNQEVMSEALRGKKVDYSDLRASLTKKEITNAIIVPHTGQVTYLTKNDPQTVKTTTTSTDAAPTISDELTAAGSKVTVTRPPTGTPWFVKVLLFVLLAGVVVWLISRKSQGPQQQVKLRKDAKVTERPKVRFKDIAGADEVVEDIRDFVQFLDNPKAFTAVGAKMPSGILLHGPPGTGKTMLAKALAGESGLPFYAMSGSEFVQMYVGVGAQKVRELFDAAKGHPDGAVIFIDEIDALGRKRSVGGNDGNSERDTTLNELLVQMDGFDSSKRIVAVAATNNVDVLDPALLRPGRFSRKVEVGLADERGRLDILGLHTIQKPLADDVSLPRLAAITAGSSGADLQDLCNEAAITAAKDGRSTISHSDFVEGQLRAILGPKKQRDPATGDERRTIAYHEAGHVLTAELSNEHEKALRVSVSARGRSGGVALYGRADRMLHSSQYLHEQMVCSLGGRAAEWVVEGRVSSGAASDLQQANQIARTAVQELGFSDRVGQMTVSASGGALSEDARATIDQEVSRLVAEAYDEAVRLLTAHRGELDRLAEALIEHGDLDRDAIEAAISTQGTLPSPAVRGVLMHPGVNAQRRTIVEPDTSQTRSSGRRTRRRRMKAAVAAFRDQHDTIPRQSAPH